MIDVVKTRGNHYEVGVQQGRIYRCLVGHINMLKYLRGMKLIQAAAPIKGAPFNLVFNSMLKMGARKMIRQIASFFPNQYEKLEGLAEGFGITAEKLATLIYFVNFQGDMSMDTTVPRGACSGGIIIKGDKGWLIKNFDFPDEIGEFQIVRYTHLTKNGYSTVTATEGPLVGAISGINEKGLCLSWNAAYTHDLDLKHAPVSIVLQECLETCADTDEAISFLRKVPVPVGCIFLVLDKSLKGAIVERTASTSGVRYPEKGKFGEYVAASNSLMHPVTRAKQLPEESVWTVKGIKGEKIIVDSDSRYYRLTELLKEEADKERLPSFDDLRKIMSDHFSRKAGNKQQPGEDTVCRHGLYWKTLSSIYFAAHESKFMIHDDWPCSDNPMVEHVPEFSYTIPNIRYLRRKHPEFPYFEPVI